MPRQTCAVLICDEMAARDKLLRHNNSGMAMTTASRRSLCKRSYSSRYTELTRTTINLNFNAEQKLLWASIVTETHSEPSETLRQTPIFGCPAAITSEAPRLACWVAFNSCQRAMAARVPLEGSRGEASEATSTIIAIGEAHMLMTKRKPASIGEILVEEFMDPLALSQAISPKPWAYSASMLTNWVMIGGRYRRHCFDAGTGVRQQR